LALSFFGDRISTLRKTLKAMGGDVRIVAEFADPAPVVLQVSVYLTRVRLLIN